MQRGSVADSAPGQVKHSSAGFDTGYVRATIAQRLEQETRSAADVEDSSAGHVSGQVQNRGTSVVGIFEAGLSLGRVCLGEAVIVCGQDLAGTPGGMLRVRRHAADPGSSD